MFTKNAFLVPASILRRLPNFRGKVRALLGYYQTLGLHDTHVTVDTSLKQPVDYLVRLDLRCLHERMAYCMNEYEAETTRFLLKLYDGEGAFLDVGANIGLIAIPFAKAALIDKSLLKLASDRTFVYAVEAIQTNVDVLEINLKKNELDDRIRVVQAGVGETEKSVDIQIERDLKAGEGTGTANILSPTTDQKYERTPLQVTTLDILRRRALLPDLISLIKVDLDGYDFYAMLGARKLLSDCRPVIFGEFSSYCMNWHGQKIGDVKAFFNSLSFDVFFRTWPDFTFDSQLDSEKYNIDILVIPKERVSEFAWCIRRT